ncbi:hypothetical protein ACWJJH_19525 [Endozoicomonadaceae bacterium StTr2]
MIRRLFVKYFLAALVLFSATAFGHSQYPSRIVKDPFYTEQTVSIKIKNLNTYTQSYEISVDGKVLGVLEDVPPGVTRDVPITLKNISDNTEKNLCSTSVPKENQSMRSRVCTKVEFKW